MNNISVGVVSDYARLVQRVLRETVDTSLSVDGVIGKVTMEAVAKLADLFGLDSTSGYTPEIRTHVDGYIQKRFASDAVYRNAAQMLKVPYHHLRAVCEVESLGSAFLPDGRAVILFERHKFYSALVNAIKQPKDFKLVAQATGYKGSFQADLMERICAIYPTICAPKRGGYSGGAAEYARLDKASSIHMEAAYASASYGAFQIMGFNHKEAGYKSATEMMLAFNKSEEEQVLGLVRFIENNPSMHKALKEGNWAVFAEKYNGPAYKENSYDTKMASSAVRWAKKA